MVSPGVYFRRERLAVRRGLKGGSRGQLKVARELVTEIGTSKSVTEARWTFEGGPSIQAEGMAHGKAQKGFPEEGARGEGWVRLGSASEVTGTTLEFIWSEKHGGLEMV